MDTIHNIAKHALLTTAATLAALLATLAGPPPATAAVPCTGNPMPASVCRYLKQAVPHVQGARWAWANDADLAFILRHESGFDWCAVNPGRHDCTYHGTSSCGLFQRQPCRWYVFSSRYRQSVDGLNYIARRYGSPARAAAYWRLHHWY